MRNHRHWKGGGGTCCVRLISDPMADFKGIQFSNPISDMQFLRHVILSLAFVVVISFVFLPLPSAFKALSALLQLDHGRTHMTPLIWGWWVMRSSEA